MTRLELLEETVSNCRECNLCETRHTTVFGEGNTYNPPVMFVGEGPGYNEDRTGRPFVGPAGQLLDRMILAMGYTRADVYITNVVKCRPPDDRVPTQNERIACNSYLQKQVEFINPTVIVGLGTTSLSGLLNDGIDMSPGTTMAGFRGQWFDYLIVKEGGTKMEDLLSWPVLFTYHPAYLLRNESQKAIVWRDLQRVMERIRVEKNKVLASTERDRV